ncbi:MAG: hypothetical protein IKO55_10910 [Kiritimatiellae bacterium]|nr:hypothetical protein [Kiritimatiellia bacterium]
MKNLLFTLLLATLSVAVVTGCGRSETKPSKAMPVLPAENEDDDLPPEPEDDPPPVPEK